MNHSQVNIEVSIQKYHTSETSCLCPDYQYRRRPLGTECKHIRHLKDTLRRSLQLQFALDNIHFIPSAQSRAARMSRSIEDELFSKKHQEMLSPKAEFIELAQKIVDLTHFHRAFGEDVPSWMQPYLQHMEELLHRFV